MFLFACRPQITHVKITGPEGATGAAATGKTAAEVSQGADEKKVIQILWSGISFKKFN